MILLEKLTGRPAEMLAETIAERVYAPGNVDRQLTGEILRTMVAFQFQVRHGHSMYYDFAERLPPSLKG